MVSYSCPNPTCACAVGKPKDKAHKQWTKSSTTGAHAATLDAGDGTCVRFKLGDKDGRTHVDGTRFDPGDWGIAVRWLSRLEEDAEQRTFELEGDDSGRVDDLRWVVINSTELRLTSIEMDKYASRYDIVWFKNVLYSV